MSRAQYRDSRNLRARANIHAKYGRGDWWSFVKRHTPWVAGDRVLDLGCGAGWFWSNPDPVPPLTLTLIDRSEGMVAEALPRAHAIANSVPVSISGAAARAEALPLPDGSLDGVLAVHMLYHLSPPAAGLAEIRRVLRPGGWAVITTNGAENFRELEDLTEAIWGVRPGKAITDAFGIETGAPLLDAAFESVALHPYSETLAVTDPIDALAYLASFPPGDEATEAEKASALQRLSDGMSEGGGAFAVTKRQGLFVCRRA